MIQKRHYRKLIKGSILVLAFIAIYYAVSEIPLVKHYFSNPEELKTTIQSLGILAPLAIIFLQFFQTTISIIPSQITTIAAGFIFGPVLGTIYSLIGAFLGSMLTFHLAKKYGKELALKLFDQQDLNHFKHIFQKKPNWSLFLARIAPLFPNDLVSFGAGLTNIKLWNFNLISSLGFLVQLIILTYFGSELATGEVSTPLILITIVVTVFFFIALFEKQIKHLFFKDLHKVEKTLETKI